jgi:predicted acylesterase/phospholipase RssA
MSKTINIACLPGGAFRGVFQVGVLEQLTARGILFHGYAGCSTGSIQGGILSMADGSLEDQETTIRYLRKIWLTLPGRNSIFKGNFVEAFVRILLKKRSLFNYQPFEQLLQEYVTKPPIVPFVAVVTSLLSGRKTRLMPTTAEELKEAILASTSVPIMFPPRGPQSYVDGSVRSTAPLSEAFYLARTLSSPSTQARIFLISTCPKNPAKEETDPIVDERLGFFMENMVSILQRIFGLGSPDLITADIRFADLISNIIQQSARHGFPLPAAATNRVAAKIIRIDPLVAPYGPFEFNKQRIQEFYEHGILRANAVLDKVRRADYIC